MNVTRNLFQLCAKNTNAHATRRTNTMTKQFLKMNIGKQQRTFALASIDPSKLDVKTSDVRKESD